ncbi:MAG: substrate-binding domain-containing protein [Treponema sp.]|nr:substrate-binding domain-containing protein [Treponema sp.]
MVQKNRIFKSVVVVAFAFLFVSCKAKYSKSETSSRSKVNSFEKKPVIGFSIDTLALERWQRDLDVFMNKTKELHADIIVQNAGNSVDEQKKQLLYLMDRKVDVVVVVAKKRDSLTEPIKMLRSKGIAVISYDRLITDADISLYISVDTERVGELMARRFISTGVGKKWYLILGPEEDFNMSLLKKGVNKVIAGKGISIEGTFYTSGWNYDVSYNEAVNLITSGNIPDAILCGNDAVAGSVIKAFDDYYPGYHVSICGQDADIAACQYVVRGKQDFTVYKPISELSEMAAEYAVLLARGKKVSEIVPDQRKINNGYAEIPVVWLDPKIVEKNNIDEVVIKSGFHTYGEVYRE